MQKDDVRGGAQRGNSGEELQKSTSAYFQVSNTLYNPKLYPQNDQEARKIREDFRSKARAYKNTRMFDNHNIQEISQMPWIAPGIPCDCIDSQCKQPFKYVYEKDTGLGFVLLDEFSQKLDKRRTEIQSQNQVDFRYFREYDEIRENEIIITIEYCTNCKEHNGSTRHDEKQYYEMALNLKKEVLKSFPIIQVYLKPLIIDPSDPRSLNTANLRRRIGCFEVQIFKCTYEGQREQAILFSQLQTQTWPVFIEILNQVPTYMRTCSLSVQIELQEFKFEDIPQDKRKSKLHNKLFDIPVILRPARNQIVTNSYQLESINKSEIINLEIAKYGSDANILKRPTSSALLPQLMNSESRGTSATRPKSSYSMKSSHSYKSTLSRKSFSSKQVVEGEKELKTNERGEVIFDNIPYDVYLIDIKQTNDYQGTTRQIDIFEREEAHEDLEEYILLQHHNLCFLQINAYMKISTEDEQSNEEVVPLTNGQIIIRTQNQGGKNDGSQEQDQADEISDNMNLKYETTLRPEQYTIIVKKPGYEDSEMTIFCRAGNQELEMPPLERHPEDKPQTKKVPTEKPSFNDRPSHPDSAPKNRPKPPPSALKGIYFYIYDAITLESLANVRIAISEKKSMDRKQYITNETGQVKIPHYELFEGQIEISMQNYITITEEYGPNKLDIHSLKESISFPLIRRPDNDQEIQIFSTTNLGAPVIELCAFTPDNQQYEASAGNIVIENDRDQCRSSLRILDFRQNPGFYRIYANIFNLSNFKPNIIKLYVVLGDNLRVVEVPSAVPSTLKESAQFWDIGVFSGHTGDFYEINAPTAEITKEYKLLEYQKLIKFILNSKDRKSVLGFNKSDSLEHSDDILVKGEQIIKALENYSMGSAKNILHLFNSALTHNQLYSFKKINQKFNAFRDVIQFVDEKTNEDDEGDDDEQLYLE